MERCKCPIVLPWRLQHLASLPGCGQWTLAWWKLVEPSVSPLNSYYTRLIFILSAIFRPNIKGYEQFGSLHGFYKLESGQETVINLPGFRTKIEGVKPNLTLNREVRIALAAEDGTVISLTLQQYKNGCSEFCYGQIYKADNFIYPITDKDLVLQEVGVHGSLPSMFKAHITCTINV